MPSRVLPHRQGAQHYTTTGQSVRCRFTTPRGRSGVLEWLNALKPRHQNVPAKGSKPEVTVESCTSLWRFSGNPSSVCLNPPVLSDPAISEKASHCLARDRVPARTSRNTQPQRDDTRPVKSHNPSPRLRAGFVLLRDCLNQRHNKYQTKTLTAPSGRTTDWAFLWKHLVQ
jgi:hypothetical protein